ncbi:MAG TPA: hypothetical protein VNH21_09835, partial [Steroidobacteraceae bacterium]|nr:hypothetical protein [Steroidobacteraceae bacterium]
GDQADFSRADDGPPDLSDVIAVAILMAAHGEDASGLEAALTGLAAAKRLRLDEEKTQAVIRESTAEVTALSQALGS